LAATCFFGHEHALSYTVVDGVVCYVLGPTAAGDVRGPRNEGRFQAFVHVTVSAGRPTVSIIPLGRVLPGDFVPRARPPADPRAGRVGNPPGTGLLPTEWRATTIRPCRTAVGMGMGVWQKRFREPR